jgi:hypothetical protein
MVFGLMAFSATAAHAEKGARWLVLKTVGGAVMTETEIEEGKVTGSLEVDTPGVLHTKIAGIAVLFECKKTAAVGAVLKGEGKIARGAKVEFSECITKLNGVTNAACEPNAGGTKKGVIITAAGHALIELFKLTVEGKEVKDDIVRILPDGIIKEGKEEPAKTFATIEMSELCAIGEKVPVIGKATLKDCENLALTHLVKHLTETGPGTELWTISETAEHVATILGSAWASLGGAGVGLQWSIDPA